MKGGDDMFVIISESKNGTLKIEGQAYQTYEVAKKYVKLFQQRMAALNKVQIKFLDEPLWLEEPLTYHIVRREKII